MTILYDYQAKGVEWLLRREAQTPSGGLLCDEMGLGKTLQMIELMKRNPKSATLIVVPKSLVSQWVSELKQFGYTGTLCIYDGSKRKFDRSSQVTVCPYSVVVDLVEEEWDRVILDEGHEIRNSRSIIHKTCMRLKAQNRWILTGTPVFNKMRDFVSLCEFIRIEKKRVQAYFEDVKSEYVLRRTKTDMVPCIIENVELTMNDSELAVYSRAYEELQGGSCVLKGILRCRQVCAWPQLYFDGLFKEGLEKEQWNGSTRKMDYLVESLSTHIDEKTIVFTHFKGESLAVKRHIENEIPGTLVFILDGSTPNRQEVIEGFKNSQSGSVFVIQIKTGGVGLNLQEATRIYIMQPSWNYATETQAIARAHRKGQTKPVYVKKLVYSEVDNVELEMVELENAKQNVYKKVTGESEKKFPDLCSRSNFTIKLGKNLCDIE